MYRNVRQEYRNELLIKQFISVLLMDIIAHLYNSFLEQSFFYITFSCFNCPILYEKMKPFNFVFIFLYLSITLSSLVNIFLIFW
jgi:hypothetical protein